MEENNSIEFTIKTDVSESISSTEEMLQSATVTSQSINALADSLNEIRGLLGEIRNEGPNAFTEGMLTQTDVVEQNLHRILELKQKYNNAATLSEKEEYGAQIQKTYNQQALRTNELKESVSSYKTLGKEFIEGARAVMPLLVSEMRRFSVPQKNSKADVAPKDFFVNKYIGSDNYKNTIASIPQAKDTEAMTKLVEALATFAIPATQRKEYFGKVVEKPTETNVRQLLPKQFGNIGFGKNAVVDRVYDYSAKNTLNGSQKNNLIKLIQRYPFLQNEMIDSGILRVENGWRIMNESVNMQNINALAGEVADMFEVGARGRWSSGIDDIENPKYLDKIKNKTNKYINNARAAAVDIAEFFPDVDPGRYSGISFTKQNVGRALDRTSHSGRVPTMEFKEITFDNIGKDGTIKSTNDKGTFSYTPVEDSLYQRRLSGVNGADKFVQNGLNKNEIMLALPTEGIETEEGRAALTKKIASAISKDLIDDGYKYKFTGFTQTHAMFTRHDIVDDIVSKDPNFFTNGISQRTFDEFQPYAKTEYNHKLNRTAGADIRDLYGSDLSKPVVVVADLKKLTGLDGLNFISDKLVPESFQGRSFAGKATYNALNIQKVLSKYPEYYNKDTDSYVFPAGGVNGTPLVIPRNVDIIEDMSNIKSASIYEGMTQEQINEVRAKEISEKGIFAKTSYENSETNPRFISAQIAKTMKFTPSAYAYFDKVRMQELAALDDPDAVIKLLFSGNDVLSRNVQQDRRALVSREAQNRISEYRDMIIDRTKKGDLLIPEGAAVYQMIGAWMPDVINSAITAGGGKLTEAQQRMSLNNAVLSFTQKAKEVGLGRNPGSMEGNVLATNKASSKFFSDLALELGIDQKGLYMNPRNAILEKLQGADMDGDTALVYSLRHNGSNSEFGKVMREILIATAEQVKETLESTNLTPEGAEKRRVGQIRSGEKRSYSLDNPVDRASWWVNKHLDEFGMGGAQSVFEKASQYSPTNQKYALAKVDAANSYNYNSTARTKSGEIFVNTDEQWAALRSPNPFTKLANWALKARTTIQGDDGKPVDLFDYDKFYAKNIDKINFTSYNQTSDVAAALDNFAMVQRGYGSTSFDWDELLHGKALPEGVTDDSETGKYMRMMRDLRADALNGAFVAFDDALVDRLKTHADAAKREIANYVQSKDSLSQKEKSALQRKLENEAGIQVAYDLENIGLTETNLNKPQNAGIKARVEYLTSLYGKDKVFASSARLNSYGYSLDSHGLEEAEAKRIAAEKRMNKLEQDRANNEAKQEEIRKGNIPDAPDQKRISDLKAQITSLEKQKQQILAQYKNDSDQAPIGDIQGKLDMARNQLVSAQNPQTVTVNESLVSLTSQIESKEQELKNMTVSSLDNIRKILSGANISDGLKDAIGSSFGIDEFTEIMSLFSETTESPRNKAIEMISKAKGIGSKKAPQVLQKLLESMAANNLTAEDLKIFDTEALAKRADLETEISDLRARRETEADKLPQMQAVKAENAKINADYDAAQREADNATKAYSSITKQLQTNELFDRYIHDANEFTSKLYRNNDTANKAFSDITQAESYYNTNTRIGESLSDNLKSLLEKEDGEYKHDLSSDQIDAITRALQTLENLPKIDFGNQTALKAKYTADKLQQVDEQLDPDFDKQTKAINDFYDSIRKAEEYRDLAVKNRDQETDTKVIENYDKRIAEANADIERSKQYVERIRGRYLDQTIENDSAVIKQVDRRIDLKNKNGKLSDIDQITLSSQDEYDWYSAAEKQMFHSLAVLKNDATQLIDKGLGDTEAYSKTTAEIERLTKALERAKEAKDNLFEKNVDSFTDNFVESLKEANRKNAPEYSAEIDQRNEQYRRADELRQHYGKRRLEELQSQINSFANFDGTDENTKAYLDAVKEINDLENGIIGEHIDPKIAQAYDEIRKLRKRSFDVRSKQDDTSITSFYDSLEAKRLSTSDNFYDRRYSAILSQSRSYDEQADRFAQMQQLWQSEADAIKERNKGIIPEEGHVDYSAYQTAIAYVEKWQTAIDKLRETKKGLFLEDSIQAAKDFNKAIESDIEKRDENYDPALARIREERERLEQAKANRDKLSGEGNDVSTLNEEIKRMEENIRRDENTLYASEADKALKNIEAFNEFSSSVSDKYRKESFTQYDSFDKSLGKDIEKYEEYIQSLNTLKVVENNKLTDLLANKGFGTEAYDKVKAAVDQLTASLEKANAEKENLLTDGRNAYANNFLKTLQEGNAKREGTYSPAVANFDKTIRDLNRQRIANNAQLEESYEALNAKGITPEEKAAIEARRDKLTDTRDAIKASYDEAFKMLGFDSTNAMAEHSRRLMPGYNADTERLSSYRKQIDAMIAYRDNLDPLTRGEDRSRYDDEIAKAEEAYRKDSSLTYAAQIKRDEQYMRQLQRNRYQRKRRNGMGSMTMFGRAYENNQMNLMNLEGEQERLNALIAEKQTAFNDKNTPAADKRHLGQDLEKLKAELAAVGEEMEQLKGPAGVANAAFQALGQSASRLVAQLGRRMFQQAINEMKQFVQQYDATMTEIQMVTLKTDAEIDTIGDSLVAMARDLKVSFKDVGSGAVDLYRQGLDTDGVKDRLEDVMKFATVTSTKTSDAIKLVTVAMNNGMVDSAKQAMDIVAALGDSAATNATEITKGLQKVLPTAASMGISYEETVAMLTGIASKTQLGGRNGGTALNTMLSRLMRVNASDIYYDENGEAVNGSQMARLINSFGISTEETDANGNKSNRSPVAILRDVANIWETLSDVQKNAFTNLFGGTRQLANVAAIMDAFSELDENGQSLIDTFLGITAASNGAVDNKYQAYLDSLVAAQTNLKNSMDSIAQSTAAQDVMLGFYDILSKIVGGFESFAGLADGWIVKIIALAVAFTALKSAISIPVIGPVIGAGLGIAGLVGGVSYLAGSVRENTTKKEDLALAGSKKTIENRESLIAEGNRIVEKNKNNKDGIIDSKDADRLKQIFTSLSGTFVTGASNVEKLSEKASDAATALKEAADSTTEFKKSITIKDTVDGLVNVVSGLDEEKESASNDSKSASEEVEFLRSFVGNNYHQDENGNFYKLNDDGTRSDITDLEEIYEVSNGDYYADYAGIMVSPNRTKAAEAAFGLISYIDNYGTDDEKERFSNASFHPVLDTGESTENGVLLNTYTLEALKEQDAEAVVEFANAVLDIIDGVGVTDEEVVSSHNDEYEKYLTGLYGTKIDPEVMDRAITYLAKKMNDPDFLSRTESSQRDLISSWFTGKNSIYAFMGEEEPASSNPDTIEGKSENYRSNLTAAESANKTTKLEPAYAKFISVLDDYGFGSNKTIFNASLNDIGELPELLKNDNLREVLIRLNEAEYGTQDWNTAIADARYAAYSQSARMSYRNELTDNQKNAQAYADYLTIQGLTPDERANRYENLSAFTEENTNRQGYISSLLGTDGVQMLLNGFNGNMSADNWTNDFMQASAKGLKLSDSYNAGYASQLLSLDDNVLASAWENDIPEVMRNALTGSVSGLDELINARIGLPTTTGDEDIEELERRVRESIAGINLKGKYASEALGIRSALDFGSKYSDQWSQYNQILSDQRRLERGRYALDAAEKNNFATTDNIQAIVAATGLDEESVKEWAGTKEGRKKIEKALNQAILEFSTPISMAIADMIPEDIKQQDLDTDALLEVAGDRISDAAQNAIKALNVSIENGEVKIGDINSDDNVEKSATMWKEAGALTQNEQERAMAHILSNFATSGMTDLDAYLDSAVAEYNSRPENANKQLSAAKMWSNSNQRYWRMLLDNGTISASQFSDMASRDVAYGLDILDSEKYGYGLQALGLGDFDGSIEEYQAAIDAYNKLAADPTTAPLLEELANAGGAYAEVVRNLADAARGGSKDVDSLSKSLADINKQTVTDKVKQLYKFSDNAEKLSDAIENIASNDIGVSLDEAFDSLDKLTKNNDAQYLLNKLRKGGVSALNEKEYSSFSNYTGYDKNSLQQAKIDGTYDDILMKIGLKLEFERGNIEGEIDAETSEIMNLIATDFKAATGIPFSAIVQYTIDGKYDISGTVDAMSAAGYQINAAWANMLSGLNNMGVTFDIVMGSDGTLQMKSDTSKVDSGSSGVRRGGGGGSGKSAADKLVERLKYAQGLYDHQLKMIQYEQTMYENADELTNYGNMLQEEIDLENAFLPVLSQHISMLRDQLNQTKEGSEDWYKLRDAILSAEEKYKETSNAIADNTKKLKENQQAILKLHTDLEDSVTDEIKNRIQLERDMLDGAVSMQSTITDAIKQRYQDEWDLVKKDIDKKKEALEKEKSLIDERLKARKEAEDEAEKYAELAELKKQLALIQMDSTRTKDAAELRKSIADLEKDIGWDISEKQAENEKNSIQDQIDAYDDYEKQGDEDLHALLDDANNFAEEVNNVLKLSQADLFEWLKSNVKEYANSLDDAQKQMINSWEDLYKKMLGIVDTYWDQVAEILNSKGSFIEYMMQSQDYQNASEDMRKQMIYQWEDAYDKWIKALKDTSSYAHNDSGLGDWIGSEYKGTSGRSSGGSGSGSSGSGSGSGAGTNNNTQASGKYGIAINGKYISNVRYATKAEAEFVAAQMRSSGMYESTDSITTGLVDGFVNPVNTSSSGSSASGRYYVKYGNRTGGPYSSIGEASKEAQTWFKNGTVSSSGTINIVDKNGNLVTTERYSSGASTGSASTSGTASKGWHYQISKDGKIVVPYSQSPSYSTREKAQAAGSAAASKQGGKYATKQFALGGMNYTTGLAWLDGTKEKPERILNWQQTRDFNKLVEIMDDMRSGNVSPVMMHDLFNWSSYINVPSSLSHIGADSFKGNNNSIGDINVIINEAEINDDRDIDELASAVGERFAKEISKQGFGIANFQF